MRSRMALTAFLMLALLPASGQDYQGVGELEQFFQTDPANAFDEAWRLFQEPLAREDVDGMMAVFRIVAEQSIRCYQGDMLRQMADALVPIAEKLGRWSDVGEIHGARAVFLESTPAWWRVKQRILHFIDLGLAAYEKAGEDRTGEWPFNRRNHHATETSRIPDPDHYGGEPFAAGMRDLAEAIGLVDDVRAVAVMSELLDAVEAAGALEGGRVDRAVADLAGCVWLPGAAHLVERLIDLATERPGMAWGLSGSLPASCLMGWTGREDPYWRGFQWCVTEARRLYPETRLPGELGQFSHKLRAYGRDAEALEVVRWWLAETAKLPIEVTWGQAAPKLLWEGCPGDMWTQAARLAAETYVRYEQWGHPPFQGHPGGFGGGLAAGLMSVVPEALREQRALEAAELFAEFGLQFPKASSQSLALADAADLYEQAGRPERAKQCHELSLALAQDDPAAMLRSALVAARALASDGKWDALVKLLEGSAARQDNTQETLQAALLLHEAYLRLDKPTEAETWIQRAWELVSSLPLTPAEKANYLMSMANLCEVAVQSADGKAGGK